MRQQQKHEHKQMSLIEAIKGPVRVIVFNEFIGFTILLRFGMMYIPMFKDIYRAYSQITGQLIAVPMTAIGSLNQGTSFLPRLIRQFVGGYAPYLGLFLYFTHKYLTESLIPNLKNESTWMIFYLQVMQMIVLVTYLICYISVPGNTSHNWTKQDVKKLQSLRAEFQTQRCLCVQCQQPKIARSAHCRACNACTARFTEHSMIINSCIGAKNYFQFLLFLWSVTLYICFCVFVIFKSVDKEKNYKGGLQHLFIQIGLLYILKHLGPKALRHVNLAIHNLTEHEVDQWQRIPYLWKNQYKEFENPFYKGICHSLFELMVPVLQGEVRASDVKSDKKEYELMEQDEGVNNNDVEGNEGETGFQDEDKPGTEMYRGKYVNWLNAKYYTVMDIPGNHPMKLATFTELKNRGAVINLEGTNAEMKRQWQKYLKEQLSQKRQYQQTVNQMSSEIHSAKNRFDQNHQHSHDGEPCNHDHGNEQKNVKNIDQQLKEASSVDNIKDPLNMSEEQISQMRQQTQQQMKLMMQKKMMMMQQQQMGKQEENDEQGGLLSSNNVHQD